MNKYKALDAVPYNAAHLTTACALAPAASDTPSTTTTTTAPQTLNITRSPDLTPGRRFHPENVYPDHFTREDIQVTAKQWMYLACPDSKAKCADCACHACHRDSLVVAIDGACSGNDKTGGQASVGVFYGDGNDMNLSKLLGAKLRRTSQVAELNACLHALRGMRHIAVAPPASEQLAAVVIKSDSEYVVCGLTEWLPKWKKNGWKNCKGLPVANAALFQHIDALIEGLERVMSVKFWLVPREANHAADSLARDALG